MSRGYRLSMLLTEMEVQLTTGSSCFVCLSVRVHLNVLSWKHVSVLAVVHQDVGPGLLASLLDALDPGGPVAAAVPHTGAARCFPGTRARLSPGAQGLVCFSRPLFFNRV